MKPMSKAGKNSKSIKSEFHSINIKTEFLQQIGIDTCSLFEDDGFKHLVVSVDHFNLWTEAKLRR